MRMDGGRAHLPNNIHDSTCLIISNDSFASRERLINRLGGFKLELIEPTLFREFPDREKYSLNTTH